MLNHVLFNQDSFQDDSEMVKKTKPGERPKQRQRKGLWSPEEDHKLTSFILSHGISCWTTVPIKAGLQRNGKSCRLRWINYLRPGLKRGMINAEEEETILKCHSSLGNKWSQIAKYLPGRTDNEIKNYWHSHLKKRCLISHVSHVACGERNPKTLISDHVISFQQSSEKTFSPPSQESNSSGPEMPRIFFSEWFSTLDPHIDHHSSDLTDYRHCQAPDLQGSIPQYEDVGDLMINNSNWTLNDVVFGSKFQKQDHMIGDREASDCKSSVDFISNDLSYV